ncbi:MAG: MmgE/PrpD family protein [Alphaproteobacteria bacterium]|nr:MmgE/PrpD family protein [Alphaproteobacteria bacterium]
MTTAPAAESIARWVVAFDLDHAPHDARHEAVRSILDVIGVSIAGIDHETCQRMRALAATEYGPGNCTVIGGAKSGSASAAALVNGVAAHVLDYEDVSYEGMVHATAVVWPAILAAAEQAGTTGRRALEAFMVGVEVDCALGRAFTHELFWRGFWTTGLLGAIGAAAGAAKALALDHDATVAAIEIAAAQASGLRAIVGSPMKSVACGLAAELGLRAALIARASIHGPRDLLGHRHGFAALLNQCALDIGEVAKPGSHFTFAASPMAFKQFPICSYGQAAAEALLDARAELGAEPVAVRCEVAAEIIDNMPYSQPANPTEAQFSLSFAPSTASAFGALTPKHLTTATIADPRRMAIAKLIDTRVAAGDAVLALAGSREGAVITVASAQGRRVTKTFRVPTGMPDRPISTAGLQAKFHAYAAPTLGSSASAALLGRIQGIERLARITGLFSHLPSTPKTSAP